MISTALAGILSGPAFNFQSVNSQPVSIADKPATLSIPAGIDGLVHEAPGVLRAVSKTEESDGTRHEHLLTYRWSLMPTGWRYAILSCNCECCGPRQTPACRHAIAADTLLNHFLVKSHLLAHHTGQSGACEIVRAWAPKARCYGCGSPTLYVHLYRPVAGSGCRANDRNTVCTGCGLWRHHS